MLLDVLDEHKEAPALPRDIQEATARYGSPVYFDHRASRDKHRLSLIEIYDPRGGFS